MSHSLQAAASAAAAVTAAVVAADPPSACRAAGLAAVVVAVWGAWWPGAGATREEMKERDSRGSQDWLAVGGEEVWPVGWQAGVREDKEAHRRLANKNEWSMGLLSG